MQNDMLRFEVSIINHMSIATRLTAYRSCFKASIETNHSPNRTFAISEAEQLTQRKSKTADRGLRLHRFVLALLRARAQHRGARARARARDRFR